jgi:ABC-type branched-subunit amino acid transport system substrate-binding protein
MKRVLSRRMAPKGYRYAVVLLVFGLPSLAAAAATAATATNESAVCGAGTLYDSANEACYCDASTACESSLLGSDDDLKTVHIAGILDTGNFHWADEIFNVTISLLNNRSDGFHDDIFLDETVTIEYELANDDCEETAATRAYWDLRRTTEGAPIHGIVGSRCSGASIAVARIASLEGVAQVSPISSSAILSNDEEFPYFSRLVSPSDHRGAVGSLIAMLRSFSFSRVSIIAADTQYGKDTMNEFRKAWSGDHFDENGALLWKGRVSYANTVSLLPSGDIDEESARQVLLGVPTEDPTVNSRVIVLISQEEQGFPILKLANEMGFQKDTIWTGIAWIARDSFIGTEWLPEYPGYLGMAPFRNQDAVVKEYIRLVREVQLSYGRQPWDGLDHYAMEYVADAIVTLVRALSNVPASQRRNGTAITNEIRQLTMNGVSGPVSFTENGDRADPLFSMYNYQKLPDGTFDWIEIGTSGTNASTTKFFVERGDICFAEVGCNLAEFPSDVYAIPKPKTPTWVYVVIPIILTLLLGLAFKYWRKSVNHKATMESMAAMQERMNELEKINDKIGDIDREVDDAIKKKDELILRRGSLLNRPDTWSNSNKVLVEVDPCDDQYWDVSDQLQKTMRTAHISKLWRVQNSSLWSYYSFHMHRLLKSKIETNESAAWHGTSSMDPSVVYNDRQDGFMMQYSERGFWG